MFVELVEGPTLTGLTMFNSC